MTIFIDSGAFIAYYNKRDEFHNIAIELFNELEKGSFGYATTSDYMLNEATARVMAQMGKDHAVNLGRRIFGDYPVLHVDVELFEQAWDKFVRLKPFSLADCTTLILMEKHGIDYLFTFDRAFKNFVKTIGVK